MTEALLTMKDITQRMRCGRKKVAAEATRHGIGIQLGGSAGWRFTEADYERLLQAMRPQPEPAVRRRRRRAS